MIIDYYGKFSGLTMFAFNVGGWGIVTSVLKGEWFSRTYKTFLGTDDRSKTSTKEDTLKTELLELEVFVTLEKQRKYSYNDYL